MKAASRVHHVLRRPRRACLAALVALWLWPVLATAQSAWLFGERHDHADHQRQTADEIARLAKQGHLHAVVIEMAGQGASTVALPPDASEAQVQAALAWNDKAWPWSRYRDVVMNAVRAGRPVFGGNLSRPQLREAMRQGRWDDTVPAANQRRLTEAVRDGHCGLLPEAQLPGMVRMQLARDDALARAVRQAAEGAGRDAVVVLLAGSAHASRELGVPLHLQKLAPRLPLRTIAFSSSHSPAAAEPGFDDWRPAPHEPPADHCAALRGAWPASSPASSQAPAQDPR
ncbi:ChaN family lipoprotein [Aquabacterium sp. A7-Y]|uniref:ChaN family lipoprotein n=1 Tax=Aquabacterium sp. A7-Y TaxID=1349605 RepID=UPI00223DCFB7|nr:ChaN family lipoprotein [Aquabacterium sp. A7-Y]MCW7539985.1 ChaN family lipoprotein [Aquabacterium sp. A7-Y]